MRSDWLGSLGALSRTGWFELASEREGGALHREARLALVGSEPKPQVLPGSRVASGGIAAELFDDRPQMGAHDILASGLGEKVRAGPEQQLERVVRVAVDWGTVVTGPAERGSLECH
jgi:hypothetical protein